MPRVALASSAAAVVASAVWTALAPGQAALSLLVAAAALILGGAAWLETGPATAKEVALVATIAAVGAAGRVLMHPFPGVQPLTVITIATGVALGLRAGVAVGATAAFVSNWFLGQGAWTPWQMLAWALCGAAGAVLAPLLRRRIAFAAACFVLGFAFSGLMDVWEWFSFYPHTWTALAVQVGRGFWFDVAHAVGNVVFALAIGPELRRLLERAGRRLHTEVVWA